MPGQGMDVASGHMLPAVSRGRSVSDERTVKLKDEPTQPESPTATRSIASDDSLSATFLLKASTSPLQVLHLKKEVLLYDVRRRIVYQMVNLFARILPTLVVYGGTACLIICSIYHFRWGVLLSLTLFTIYMVHLSSVFLVCATIGLFRVFQDSRTNWTERLQSQQRSKVEAAKPCEVFWTEGDLQGCDVIHVVILPTYKTPIEILQNTLTSLARGNVQSGKNMGVCLAFEEREDKARQKDAELRELFEDQFLFMTATFHPPNLPDHVPGKSSNECWAFQELRKELEEVHKIPAYDPRVVITVMDDDSEMHQKYFEALTYHFVMAGPEVRYLRSWQAPICQFKNYLNQPMLVRISSIFATLNELSVLANPLDCRINFSTYSISMVLASAVGGWDPDYLAEDWHMFAKCSLMTEGRMKCHPIFLPTLNYTPEEDTYCGTLESRWTQAKRHALGVSEIVYLISTAYVAVLELPSFGRVMLFLWRLMPLLAKMAQTHFINGLAGVWTLLAQVVIHVYLSGAWCHMSDLGDKGACPLGGDQQTDDQIMRNSLLVYWQQRATAILATVSILSGGLGAVYFHMVRDRVDGNTDAHPHIRILPLMWLVIEIEVSCCGLIQSIIFGAMPTWIACLRVIAQSRFAHVVAGMVGRGPEDADP